MVHSFILTEPLRSIQESLDYNVRRAFLKPRNCPEEMDGPNHLKFRMDTSQGQRFWASIPFCQIPPLTHMMGGGKGGGQGVKNTKIFFFLFLVFFVLTCQADVLITRKTSFYSLELPLSSISAIFQSAGPILYDCQFKNFGTKM